MSTTKTYKPLYEHPHPTGMGGTQRVYKFENSYGASVVRFYGSYGYAQGLWELGVLEFRPGTDNFVLTYSTPVTDDVIGHLTEDEVAETLAKIEALPAKDAA